MSGEWIDRLKAAIEEAAAENIAGLSDALLAEGFSALQRAAETVSAQRLRRLSEIDRRKTFAEAGHLSTTSWLVGEFKLAGGEAAGAVKMARALEEMPETREALAAGEVSTSAVRVLVSARESSPEAFSKDEGLLIQTAREHTVDGLSRVASAWRQRVDAERALQDLRRLRAARRLRISPVPSGMVRIDGDLDPETGEVVMTALKAVTDAEAKSAPGPDGRSMPQRRADALGTVCRGFLDRSDRPMVGGERPHITVTVDVDALRGDVGLCELDLYGPIHPAVLGELSCDAVLTRVLTTGRSQPLDVGRKTKVVPTPIRQAVVARDRTCRFPSCDRSAGWCHCHHVIHWTKGGHTAVSNLVLLCGRHHRAIHEGLFSVEMTDGEPRFRRRDGTAMPHPVPPRGPP